MPGCTRSSRFGGSLHQGLFWPRPPLAINSQTFRGELPPPYPPAAKPLGGGYTLIPTRVYFKDGRAKVEIALARGKEGHDKRQELKASEAKREMERALKSNRR